MGERCLGMAKVTGSNPVVSTMDKKIIQTMAQEVSEQLGVSKKEARRLLKCTFQLVDACQEYMDAHPYDNFIEEMTDQDCLIVRNILAENRMEKTPEEIQGSLELIRQIMTVIREEGNGIQ